MPFCKGIYPKTKGKNPKECKGVQSSVASLLRPVVRWVCSGNHQIPDRPKFSVTPFSTRTVLVPEHKHSASGLCTGCSGGLGCLCPHALPILLHNATSSEKFSGPSYLPTSLSLTLYRALFFSQHSLHYIFTCLLYFAYLLH